MRSSEQNSDEIDLAELGKSIWSQRGLVLGVMLFVIVAVLIFHLTKATFRINNRVDYPISVVFLNEESRYPNNTAFSPLDIISSRVVAQLAEEYKLSADNLNKALSSNYSNSVLLKTEQKLSEYLMAAKTPADVIKAAETALEQMRNKGRRVVTVSLDANILGVDSATARKLLVDLVEAWSQQAIERGLMNQDLAYPAGVFKVAKNASLLDTYEAINSYALSIGESISQLEKMSGGKGIIVGQQSISDLKRNLENIINSDIMPLRSFAYSNALVLSKNDPAMNVRIMSRKRLLEIDSKHLEQLIAAYDIALEKITKEELAGFGNNNTGIASTQMPSAQIDHSFLDSLLGLGYKLSSVEMREEIFRLKNKAIAENLEVKKELEMLSDSGSSYQQQKVVELLQGSLDGIITDVNDIQANLVKFIKLYREQTLNSGANLYIPDSAPQLRGGILELGKKFGLFVALGATLGLLLGIFAALIRAAIRQRAVV